MTTPNEAQLRAFFPAYILERGREYCSAGRVRQFTRSGNVLTALVQGSQYSPYEVVIHLDDRGALQSVRCTCPYSAEPGHCKHVAAVLLLAGRPMPATPTPAPAPQPQPQPHPTESALALVAELGNEQLRQVIDSLLREEPAFADVLVRRIALQHIQATDKRPLPSLLPALLESARREIRQRFGELSDLADQLLADESDYVDTYDDDYRDMDGDGYLNSPPFPADLLEHQFEVVDSLADNGEVDAALTLLDVVLETWLLGVEDMPKRVAEEYPDDIDAISQSLVQLLTSVLLRPEASAQARAACAAAIEQWLADLPELELPLAAARYGWDHPPLLAVLRGETVTGPIWGDVSNWVEAFLVDFHLNALLRQGREEEYLNLTKAVGRSDLYVYRLAQMGRTEEAVAAARQALGTPNEYLRLVHILWEKGEHKQAVTVAAEGLDLEDRRGRLDLALWLRVRATATGDMNLALKGALLIFMASCNLDDYRAVEQLAGGGWPDLKPELLAHLAQTARPELQAKIYLAERMAPEAMALAERHPTAVDLVAVLELAGSAHPDWSINVCKRRAEAVIQRGSADHYPEALPWLRRAQATYRDHGRLGEWQAYLAALIEANRRKHRLVPLLRALR